MFVNECRKLLITPFMTALVLIEPGPDPISHRSNRIIERLQTVEKVWKGIPGGMCFDA